MQAVRRGASAAPPRRCAEKRGRKSEGLGRLLFWRACSALLFPLSFLFFPPLLPLLWQLRLPGMRCSSPMLRHTVRGGSVCIQGDSPGGRSASSIVPLHCVPPLACRVALGRALRRALRTGATQGAGIRGFLWLLSFFSTSFSPWPRSAPSSSLSLSFSFSLTHTCHLSEGAAPSLRAAFRLCRPLLWPCRRTSRRARCGNAGKKALLRLLCFACCA